MLPNLYAVVVNWNLWPDTIRCVESLLAAGAERSHVVVVDNDSTDESVPRLRAHFGDELRLVLSAQNVGFGSGANLGIRYALSQAAKWVLVLNNDTIVSPTFLQDLARATAEAPQYAIYGPRILYLDDPERVWYLGDRRLFGTLITRSLFRGRRAPVDLPVVMPVEFLTGCCLLIRAEVLAAVQPFDPNIFMYGEDVDFCWRAHLAGFRLAAVPGAHMWHKVGSSSNRNRPAARYWQVSNQIRFYRRYSRSWNRAVLFAFTVGRAAWLAARDLSTGQLTLLRPLMAAWWEGWFGTDRAARTEPKWKA